MNLYLWRGVVGSVRGEESIKVCFINIARVPLPGGVALVVVVMKKVGRK